jgi:hypothetical protein
MFWYMGFGEWTGQDTPTRAVPGPRSLSPVLNQSPISWSQKFSQISVLPVLVPEPHGPAMPVPVAEGFESRSCQGSMDQRGGPEGNCWHIGLHTVGLHLPPVSQAL